MCEDNAQAWNTTCPTPPDVHLSDHDLRQLDDAALANLTPEQARLLLSKAIEDLKNARERLAQNPANSSRPPSTRAPWEQAEGQGREPEEGLAGAGQGAESVCSERLHLEQAFSYWGWQSENLRQNHEL
jgi:hypothetical protein